MAASVILVEAAPRRASDGESVNLQLAGGGGERPYFYDAKHWRAGLIDLPRTVSTLDFDGSKLGGGGVGQALELTWAPPGGAAALASLMWVDAPILVRVGPEDGDPPVIVRGRVLEASADRNGLKLGLSEATASLKVPALSARFAGTGGIEGPPEFEGEIKSRCLGRCFNVPGRPLLAAKNIWVFGDPGRRWQAFDEVRDKGVAFEVVAELEWQGTTAATWAALEAIVVAEGTAVAAPSIACVKTWTAPAGDLHADVRGEIEPGGYIETAPAIASRLIELASSLILAPGTLDVAIAARPAPYGVRIADENTTVAALVSDMLADVSISWARVDQLIVFRLWDWTAPAASLRSHAVTRREIIKPWGTRRLGYRRNQHPMARGDLAAAVFARDVVYDDGQTLQAFLDELVSDAFLSRDEKPALKREYDRSQVDYLRKVDGLTEVGLPTAALTAARAALTGYLAGLAPAWDDASVNTPIIAVDFRAAWSGYAAAAELADSQIKSKASVTADDITPPAPVVIQADHLGNVVPGQLPMTVFAARIRRGANITASSTRTLTPSGGVTASLSADKQIVIETLTGIDEVIELKDERADAQTLYRLIKVLKIVAQPPSTGTAVATVYDTNLKATNSGSHAPVSAWLTLKVGASGTVNLVAPIDFRVAAGAEGGEPTDFALKWTFSADGGATISDVGSEQGASDQAFRYQLNEPPYGYVEHPGRGSCTRSKTGLTPDAEVQFRLVGRKASGDYLMSSLRGIAQASSE